MSALKQAESGATLIVRLFNPDDAAASASIELDTPVDAAYEVNLLEERQSEIRLKSGTIPIALRPPEIKTVEIVSK